MRLRPGTPEEAGMSARAVQQVVELAESWVAEDNTPSLVIVAARRGVIVLHEAFGCLGPEADTPPLQRDTLFPLASLSKPITATAAMILAEDGLLGLNRFVSSYVPEFVGEGKEAVMVHHLLTHTSGLKEDDLTAHAEKKKGSVEIPALEESQHPLVHEYLFLRCDAPLSMRPGTEMSYSDYGYRLLAEIVRRVSGRPVDEFARERIFEPLGMKDSSYIVPEAEGHRIIRRPARAFNPEWLQQMETDRAPWGDGSVFSTAIDMAAFGQMFLNGGVYQDTRILSPAAVAAMTRNQIPGIGSRFGEEFFPEAAWGLGWGIRGNKKYPGGGTLQSPATFAHPGGGGVYLWVDPAYDLVGVYFSVSLEAREGEPPKWWNADLYANAVTAAVVDV